MKLNKQKLSEDFHKFSNEWVDTIEYNSFIYDYFNDNTNRHDSLKNHADVIEKYKLGYGEKPFMYLWSLVFSQIPKNGKFLEIGVYKGSILALSQTISNELNLEISTYGLTPLNNTGDKYSNYDLDNYEQAISFLHHTLNLNMDKTFIFQGLSTNDIIKQTVIENGPYDVVYIDGGHDYDTVINDINFSEQILKPAGLLIMDDASSLLNLGPNHKGFVGHQDVGLAIKNYIDTKNTYKHLFACGHNRIWIKND